MKLRTLRFMTLLLASLAMGMKLAHALELSPKLAWPASLYIAVQSTLYSVFARVGPVFELGALLCVAVMLRKTAGTPAQRAVRVSLGCILVSVATFAGLVMPAGAQLQRWAATGTQQPDWEILRAHWQYGQTACFALHFVSLAALVWSALGETPDA